MVPPSENTFGKRYRSATEKLPVVSGLVFRASLGTGGKADGNWPLINRRRIGKKPAPPTNRFLRAKFHFRQGIMGRSLI
jgi:hypothetical protein